jgi:hypothetical protein
MCVTIGEKLMPPPPQPNPPHPPTPLLPFKPSQICAMLLLPFCNELLVLHACRLSDTE